MNRYFAYELVRNGYKLRKKRVFASASCEEDAKILLGSRVVYLQKQK